MNPKAPSRSAFSITELFVVIAIVLVVLGLLLPAVQKVRSTAYQTDCGNRLRQIGLALHGHNDSMNRLPAGSSDASGGATAQVAWLTFILPWIEQSSLWGKTEQALRSRLPFHTNPPHVGLNVVIPTYICPLDFRLVIPQYIDNYGFEVAFTSFLGVQGTASGANDGVLFYGSRIRLTDVVDGLSNTLMAGERPPSADLEFGWWYGGSGISTGGGTWPNGTADMVLGVRETLIGSNSYGCTPGSYHFTAGNLANQCDMFHFWSLHPGGAHFLMADSSIRFLSYSADAILPALATRNGSEPVALPD